MSTPKSRGAVNGHEGLSSEESRPSAQQYLDIVGVLIVVIDRGGRVSLANRKACEVLETTEEAIIGTNWFDTFLHENDRETVRGVFQELMIGKREPMEYFENRVRSARGAERTIAWHNTIIHDESGAIFGTLSSGEDITERRQIHEALQRSEARYLDLYDSAPVPYLSVSFDGSISRVNRAAEAFTGYEKQELLGMPVIRLHGEQSLPAARDFIERLRMGRSCDGVEMVYRRKDGSRIDGLLTVSPVLDDGHVVEGRLVVVDITERRQAEARERGHAEDLAFLSETAMEFVDFPTGGDIHAFIGEKTQEIIGGASIISVSDFDEDLETFRPKAILGLGRKLERVLALLGKHPLEMKGDFTPETKILLSRGRLTKVEGGLIALSAVSMKRVVADGAQKLFGFRDVFVIGFVREGTIHGALVILTLKGSPPLNMPLAEAFAGQAAVALARRRSDDRLRQAEEQLRQSQKMEAIGQLAGGVAHDFNNMLCAIAGSAELALDSSGVEDPVRADLTTIKGAADRAAALTRQLLAFSRKQTLQPRTLDLNTEVEGLRKMLERLIGENISLVTDLSPKLGHVRADPSQIDQVIINLSVNARDAMPEGGTLTIETKNVELDLHQARDWGDVLPGPFVNLSITDTGEGMDETTQTKIFEPFFTTKALGRGTGLGLATVYGIVKQSGGTIQIRSAPGEGSSFALYLPRIGAETAARDTKVTVEITPDRPTTILIAEDEDIVRKLINKMLTTRGYATLSARNGAEAVQLLEQHQGAIDMLITDVIMPEVGGRRLADRCRVLRPETIVLYMSGYTSEAMGGPLDSNANFIQKPFRRDELVKKVHALLEAKRT